VSDAIARFTVEADWDAERPLSDAARTAYAEHGTLLPPATTGWAA
jgi:hypothetical protein